MFKCLFLLIRCFYLLVFNFNKNTRWDRNAFNTLLDRKRFKVIKINENFSQSCLNASFLLFFFIQILYKYFYSLWKTILFIVCGLPGHQILPHANFICGVYKRKSVCSTYACYSWRFKASNYRSCIVNIHRSIDSSVAKRGTSFWYLSCNTWCPCWVHTSWTTLK